MIDLPSRRPLSPSERLLLFVLLAGVALVHFYSLSLRSMWNDEFITLDTLDLSYSRVIVERLENNHSPAYFLMLKAWTSIYGMGEKSLHFPSTLGVLLGIAFVWRVAARLWGERWAMLALALAGFNQMILQEGNDARMYGLLFGAAAMTLWAFIGWLDRGRRRDFVWLVVAGIFGLSLHLLYLLVSAVLIIFVLKRRAAFPDRWRGALAAVFLPLVVLAPLIVAWAMLQHKVGQAHGWQPFDLTDALRMMIMVFAGDHHVLGSRPVQYLGIALTIAALALTARSLGARLPAAGDERLNPAAVDLLWIWCGVPTLAIALASLRSAGNLSQARYFIVIGAASPPLIVATAVALQSKGRRVAAYAGAGLFLLTVCANAGGYLHSRGSGLREVARHIAKEYRPGDALIVSKRRNRTRAFVYYGPLKSEPPELPDDLDGSTKIADWAQRMAKGKDRLWAVFYDPPRKDTLAGALGKHPEIFKPEDNLFTYGETSSRLYRVIPNVKVDSATTRSAAAR